MTMPSNDSGSFVTALLQSEDRKRGRGQIKEFFITIDCY
jgi:hypothetical protein